MRKKGVKSVTGEKNVLDACQIQPFPIRGFGLTGWLLSSAYGVNTYLSGKHLPKVKHAAHDS